MVHVMLRATLVALLATSLDSSLADARRMPEERIPTITRTVAASPFDGPSSLDARFTIAAANTTVLGSFSFNFGASCSPQGWTTVDNTINTGVFWHVDDFAGVNLNPGDTYAPLASTKSLWCGVRASATGELCMYATLPGYGNNWNQAWHTKNCIPVAGDLDVSLLLRLDTEADYDYLALEYTSDCNASYDDWTLLDGKYDWDGVQTISHAESYALGAGPMRVRLRFFSDSAYADQDGMYNSHAGPALVDNLSLEGALEDFEGEPVGSTVSNDWQGLLRPGFGNHFALFAGSSLLQEDVCAKNLSCVWAAISTSSDTYACGGHPLQVAVPVGVGSGEYIDNEIWSPPIALTGSGSRVDLRFSVYRDLQVNRLVYYTWSVRNIVNGCPGPWRNRNNLYFGDQ